MTTEITDGMPVVPSRTEDARIFPRAEETDYHTKNHTGRNNHIWGLPDADRMSVSAEIEQELRERGTRIVPRLEKMIDQLYLEDPNDMSDQEIDDCIDYLCYFGEPGEGTPHAEELKILQSASNWRDEAVNDGFDIDAFDAKFSAAPADEDNIPVAIKEQIRRETEERERWFAQMFENRI